MRDLSKLLSRWKNPLRFFGIAGLAALLSVAIYGAVQYYNSPGGSGPAIASLDNPAYAKQDGEVGQLSKASESFRNVAKKVGPAVLNIKATRKGGGAQPGMMMPRGEEEEGEMGGGGDPFSEFFNRFGAPFPFQGGPQQEAGPQVSMGSGILIDKLGHVVTNNHVVDGAEEVVVSLADQKTDIKAKVVGTDSKTDLAVLKLESTKGLPEPAEWADSDKVEVGDWSVAIGSPFALGQSVTVGIVSAKGNRNSLALTGAEYGGDLLQTDAAINPGNSGGPLCDLNGHVMGVNTAIYTRSGGYMGIGFAIPSNLAKDISGKLIKDGKVIRGWLGVYIQPADEELLKRAGITGGVAVHEVMEESPAGKAGIKAGDILTEITVDKTKNPVHSVNQLQTVVSSIKPGQKADIRVYYEDGKDKFQSKVVSVTLGQLPETASPAKEIETIPGGSKPDKLGLVVGPNKTKEIVVKGVQPGSVAHRIGLQSGDVLVSLNGKKIDSAQTYKKYVETSDFVRLRIRRGKRELYYQFKMGQ